MESRKARPSRTEERLFKIGLALKGLNGLFELVGAVLLAAVPDSTVYRVISFLLQQEVGEGKRDALFEAAARGLSGLMSQRGFGEFYLATHGVVKVFLVGFLYAGKKWAYPVAIGAMAVLMAYEAYRLAVRPAAMLGFILALDAAITTLIVRHALRRRRSARLAP